MSSTITLPCSESIENECVLRRASARTKRPEKSNGGKLVELAVQKKNTATAARAIPNCCPCVSHIENSRGMTRTEVTVGTEGFREYLEFILGCSMDYNEPPLKNGIDDRSTIATNRRDLRVLRARISYLRLSTGVNSRSVAVPIRPVQALNAHPGRELYASLSRHSVPGYYQPVPSGQKGIGRSNGLALS